MEIICDKSSLHTFFKSMMGAATVSFRLYNECFLQLNSEHLIIFFYITHNTVTYTKYWAKTFS